MPEPLEVLRARVLLSFVNEDPRRCTVTGLSAALGVGKQKMHRLFLSLEREGLLDRSDPRQPRLTAEGLAQAAAFERRYHVVLNHLFYEGLDIDDAEHDACLWALFCSDNGMKIIESSEQRCHAKYALRRQERFDGGALCRCFSDGDYEFPFLFYRKTVEEGSNLSMANGAFAQPCRLAVRDGVGTVQLLPLDREGVSPITGKPMHGRVRNLQYLENGQFRPAWEAGRRLCFPAAALSFWNIGAGMGQILHGSVCLKMQATVGTNHMPESTAIFTILI